MARTSGQPLTAAERARRRQRRAWIPAIIALVVIVVVGIVAATLVGNGLGRHVAVLPGVSHFTPKGIRNINETNSARFDLRNVPLDTRAIQLAPDGDKKFGPYGDAYAELTFVTKSGPLSLYVGSFHVISAGGMLTEITTDTHEPDFATMHTDLYQIANVGVTTTQLGAFMKTIPVPGKHGSVFAIKVGTGTALGVPTTVSAICAGAKGCDVRTVSRLPRQ
jgi:predicted regulator of Ras-like GTPase activity (Roadblock/LC7/MglB family)